jgi:glutamate carboxypeptidase
MKNFPLNEFLEDLKQLCAIDSGHHYGPGAEAVADFFETRYQALGLHTERRHYQDNTVAPFLLVSNSEEEDFDVLFIGHMDTVFPVGTAAQWPLTELEPGIVSGPGCADCKGGCLLLYYTIRQLMEEGKCNFRFRIAMNSDEERRSDYSRAYFEELARHAKYCFVYEPGRPNDEFVYQRKGSMTYQLKCHGISAHAGVEPEKGASAILELARWVNELDKLVDYEKGTILNVGTFHGGIGNGSVPDYAECSFSCRYLLSSAEKELEAMLQRMHTQPFDSRTSMETIFVSQRPAMEPGEATMQLLKELELAGETVGQKPAWLVTGGGSDGNFVSPFGVPVLDGCGPCGGKLHTREEYLKTASVKQRLDIMTALLLRLFP